MSPMRTSFTISLFSTCDLPIAWWIMPNSLIASLLFQIVYQLSLGHSDPESFAKSSSSVSSLKIFHQLYFS